jgi:hypothetical protein
VHAQNAVCPAVSSALGPADLPGPDVVVVHTHLDLLA